MLKTVVQSILRRSQQINKTNLKFYSVYQNKAMAGILNWYLIRQNVVYTLFSTCDDKLLA